MKSATDDPNVKRWTDFFVHGKGAPVAPAGHDDPMSQKGMKFARYVRAFGQVKGDVKLIPDALSETIGDKKMANEVEVWRKEVKGNERLQKVLDAQTPTAGQYIVPIEYSNEIIEVLRELTFVYELGSRKYPMNKQIVKIPRIDLATVAAYFGERKKTPVGQPQFGQIELKEKKLGCLVPISNDLLESSDPAADEVVKQDMTLSMALKRDEKALLGDGTDDTPMGLLQTLLGQTNQPQVLANNAFLSPDDPTKFVQKVLLKRKKILRGGWVFPSTIWLQLMNMKYQTGQYIYRDEMTKDGILKGTLLGFPYAVSDLLTLGTDSHAMGTIVFGDWSEFFVGERNIMQLMMSLEASFTDPVTGATHNAMEEDLTLVRAIDKHDFATRHIQSFAMSNTVYTQ
ncbi:MAG: phage major capsid protein [Candidatus Xenobia bacterium]